MVFSRQDGASQALGASRIWIEPRRGAVRETFVYNGLDARRAGSSRLPASRRLGRVRRRRGSLEADRIEHEVPLRLPPYLVGDCGDECGPAPQIRANIQQLLASGMTEEQVFANTKKSSVPKSMGSQTRGIQSRGLGSPLRRPDLRRRGGRRLPQKPERARAGSKTRRRRSLSAKHRKMLNRELRSKAR